MNTKLIVAAFAAVLSTSAMALPALAHPGHDHGAVAQTASGQGVVTAIDLKGGTVTLKHGPIAALKWPAMTMTFRVDSAALLNGVSVGSKVNFVLKNENGKPVVSEIHVI